MKQKMTSSEKKMTRPENAGSGFDLANLKDNEENLTEIPMSSINQLMKIKIKKHTLNNKSVYRIQNNNTTNPKLKHSAIKNSKKYKLKISNNLIVPKKLKKMNGKNNLIKFEPAGILDDVNLNLLFPPEHKPETNKIPGNEHSYSISENPITAIGKKLSCMLNIINHSRR